MPTARLTRDAVLNVLVNMVPIAMMLVFIALYLLVPSLGPSASFMGVVQIGLIVVPLVALSVLTYEAARRIEPAE